MSNLENLEKLMQLLFDQVGDQIRTMSEEDNSSSDKVFPLEKTKEVKKTDEKLDPKIWSKGISIFGLKLFGSLFMGLGVGYKNKKKIVEVGSGNGHLAKFISGITKTKVITIDPLIQKFLGNTEAKSDYKDVDAYLKTNENADINYLVLNWTNPNDGSYDVDAIQKLKPENIILLYSSCGAAGTKDLHKWICEGHKGYKVEKVYGFNEDCFTLFYKDVIKYRLIHFTKIYL